MSRDTLFALLCGVLGARGRDEALLGSGMQAAREAFARMAPEGEALHAYFELPLAGPRGLDVHCSVSEPVAAKAVPTTADPGWKAALSWFSGVAPVSATGGEVQLMAEADTSTSAATHPGAYLIQRDRAELVAPWLAVLGESDRLGTWEAFRARLPKGWETSYVGLFPGRAGGYLRVNAHPAGTDAASLPEALAQLGLRASERSRALFCDLLSDAQGFDLQLDVDGTGHPIPDFALECYLEGAALSASPWEDGRAERAFALMEACGAADGRWRTLVGVDVSRQTALPSPSGTLSCAASVRTFSAKLRLAGGEPSLAKAYLRGDALLIPRD